ncbi:SEC-C domain-containing protein [Radiobacillus kanasensis]|uniref:SEC-C metal-binding domain-containing protein n=1 Tax=Radiobacillus kanasensis TaxID=2844358 RepID=UPI001E2AC156|nr:SEC-C metal-binding domain-containing protein [Radiobacillus kanasensis]UFT98798.1 SEC-C domain-containing protein [Radiobacillus kanasensis]
MGNVGRNDPCPCGSGKKYKKCCMSNVVSLDQVVGSELDRMQFELVNYGEINHEFEVSKIIDKHLDSIPLSEDDESLTATLILMWITFKVPLKSGHTIMEEFIQEKQKEKSVRPSVLKQLETWLDTSSSFSIITNFIDDEWLEVEDLFTAEKIKVQIKRKEFQLEVGGLLFGHLLPYGSYYSYWAFPLDFPAKESKELQTIIKSELENSEITDEKQFMDKNYPDYVKSFITGENFFPYTEMEIEWDDPIYEMVADLYEEQVEELIDDPDDLIESAKLLWNAYCHKAHPTIRKPEVFAAALHYFMDVNLPSFTYFTQKDVAEMYGVSVTSVSRAYRQLEDGLKEELEMMEGFLDEMLDMDDEDFLDEMFLEDMDEDDEFEEGPFNRMVLEKTMREATEAIQGQDFDSIDELNNYVNNLINLPNPRGNRELTDRDKAMDLVYEAFETNGPKQKKLAKEALKLDSNNADAYNLLGDAETSPFKALDWYKQGMEAGERELGKDFLEDKDNQGMFWVILETRPYMRAKYNYALTLAELAKTDEAVKHFEELLILNENDNQGVRYVLFIMYVQKRDYQKAKNLLDRFQEDYTADGAYNLVLIEYLMNGLSPKLNKLLDKAKEVNPNVIDYLVGKKRLPQTVPMSYQPGDSKEAAFYAHQSLNLWKRERELVEWLKS